MRGGFPTDIVKSLRGGKGMGRAFVCRVHKRTLSDIIPAVNCPKAGVTVYDDLLGPVLH